ncbi:POTRA domain-containing protein [Cellulophaga sp. Z1A5H]|uniref:POTRA domain-containing protein n=1 Tax=Cellulophaga sp. Z1A5H TaxID=2687291 RepID=UPI0013FD5205|nr:POTRA domain-containing protein [Cellulophaga sp. Z1A5H]
MKPFFFLFCFLLLVCNSALGQEITIKEINIEGVKKTKPAFITKLITSKKGAILDTLALENDLLKLKRLPLVANATYKIKKLDSSAVRVIFTIEENFTLIPFANLFSSSNDAFAFRLGLQEFNLLGRNITLGGFYQYDIFSSYGLSVRAPYLFSNKLGLSISYTDFTTQEPVFFSEATADYKYNNKGVEVLGLYEINLKNTVEFGFSLFSEDYQYLEGFTSNEVPRALKVDKRLWKVLYNFNALNYHYQYVNGFKSALNLQYVYGAGGNLPDFVIGFNDFLFYKRIGPKGNLANRVRLGLATNSDSPFAPFTLDNNLNIRGVGNTIDRGTGAIVFNTEYRHTLIDEDWFVLQSNIFVDGGSWRNPGGELSDFSQNENIRIYPGVGLRFMHKRVFNAIFRIDYGYGITKNATKGLVFGIGQYF